MPRQHKLYLGLFVYMVALFNLIVVTTYKGLWAYPVAFVLLASPVLMYYLATRIEERFWSDILNPKHGSWAFLFGDTFFITTAVGMAGYNWQSLPLNGWYYQSWWPVTCMAAGMIAGVGFHLFDRGNYIKAGIPSALVSPTKMAHDGVAYPVLFGGTLFVVLPVVIELWSMGKYPLMYVGGWAVLCVCDMVRKLDPTKLHIEWLADEFKPAA